MLTLVGAVLADDRAYDADGDSDDPLDTSLRLSSRNAISDTSAENDILAILQRVSIEIQEESGGLLSVCYSSRILVQNAVAGCRWKKKRFLE